MWKVAYNYLMVETASTMLPLGSKAADWNLQDSVSDKFFSLADLASSKATVIMFICNHCPYVKHIQSELVALARDYQPKGVSIIAINSNDVVNYPEDSPPKMKEAAENNGYTFPYLFDESQDVAKAYKAVCTPDFYVFDGDLECAYRGQLDDSRPNNGIPVTGKDIREALDSLLTGEKVNPYQRASTGCNIKWK